MKKQKCMYEPQNAQFGMSKTCKSVHGNTIPLLLHLPIVSNGESSITSFINNIHLYSLHL